MQADFLNVGERAIQVAGWWARAYAAIRAAGLNLEATNAHTPGLTISEVDTRTLAALSSIGVLREANHATLELIWHRLPNIKAAIDTIEGQANNIVTALEPWHGATSNDSNGHLHLQMQHPERGTQTYDLGSPLAAVVQQSNVLLDSLPYVAHAAKEEGAPVFAGLAHSAGEYLLQAKDSAAKATNELSAGVAVVVELQSLSDTASVLVRQVQDVLTAAMTQRTSVDSNAADVEQKLARAREISTDADTLQQRVTGFTSQFEAFESQMKSRLAQFAEFETSSKDALRQNAEREAKISELIGKADTMIRGATTAGLSKSLEDTKDLYEKRLNQNQWYFLGSVVFLLICSLPIAAQLVPGPWQQYFVPQINGAVNDSAPWLSALGKLVLVIPGTWATAFFASNYAELFHLSREYAHKAALAKAIDGFQREAPTYKEEIVGSVFMEIQDNPGSRKASPPATPQNPVTRKFLQKVLDAIKVVKASE